MSLSRFSPIISPIERAFDRSLASTLREMENFSRRMINPYWVKNRDSLNFGAGDQITRPEDGSLSLTVDVSSFTPAELTVSVKDGNLLISGNHREEDSGSVICRQFSRSYRVPDDVDLERIKSSISEKGTLTIVAPNKNKPLKDEPKRIPIELESDQK